MDLDDLRLSIGILSEWIEGYPMDIQPHVQILQDALGIEVYLDLERTCREILNTELSKEDYCNYVRRLIKAVERAFCLD